MMINLSDCHHSLAICIRGIGHGTSHCDGWQTTSSATTTTAIATGDW